MDDRAIVLDRLGVSRETAARLDAYVDVLAKWSPALNLVSRSTLANVWIRHIEDCAQIFPLASPDAQAWLDLGSGAGLPGLIIAALAQDQRPSLRVTMVEADARKVAFLQTAARAMNTSPTIVNARIEAASLPIADVISARALAPLGKLLDLAVPHLAPKGQCLFHKGSSVASELTDAALRWHSQVTTHRSVTDPSAVILEIQEPLRASAPTR